MITNVDLDNFSDSMMVSKNLDCRILKEALYIFGRKNYPELYRRGHLKNLAKEDF